ncbi:CBY1-interacting BAR domain-containing protein 2-like isoform X2 [Cyprinodon tularosa]|nr:CBY1-interacting BAR domain-containing protein 2-like isoform X2 [Cyprinodon tularosa]
MQAMELVLNNSEKHLGELCSILASYTRKTAKLRDKVDMLVSALFDFSRSEDPEFQVGLNNLAEDLAMVQDYRHAQVERLETRVVSPLKAYGDIFKHKRTELKKFSADLNREQKEVQKLEKLRLRNPADRQRLAQAEVDAQRASTNAQQSIKHFEETMTHFQRQKLEDVKVWICSHIAEQILLPSLNPLCSFSLQNIFREFLTVEMLFHAKALEVFSHTYQNMEAMNAEKDLELFTGRIRMLDSQMWPLERSISSRSPPPTAHYSSLPLGSWRGRALDSPETSDHSRRQQPSQHHGSVSTPHINPKRHGGMEEEELAQEEDEDEEEEDEEEESGAEMEGDENIRRSYASQYAQSAKR